MSCVEYLRWQLRHCNGNGRKPENSPKPYTPTLGTREEVSLFFSLSLSLSFLEQSARSHISKVTKKRALFELYFCQKQKHVVALVLFAVFHFSSHLWLFIIKWKKDVCVCKTRHFAIYRYSLKITANQASVYDFSEAILSTGLFTSCPFKCRNPLSPHDTNGWQASCGIEAHWALHAHCNLCYLLLYWDGEM